MTQNRWSAGECYYCHEPVYVSEGQLLKELVIKGPVETLRYPVHKTCRKKNEK